MFYRFGFAKFKDVRDSEKCIRGFYRLGYEVGFARVSLDAYSWTVTKLPRCTRHLTLWLNAGEL